MTESTTLLRNEPIQARSSARLSSLLDAAAATIDKVGCERLTTAMVAERAGASIGTVYRYFPDRIVVLQSVAARASDRFSTRIDSALDHNSLVDWWSVVEKVIDELVKAFSSEPAFAALRFGDVLDLRPRENPSSGYAALAGNLASVLESRFGIRAEGRLAFRLEVALTLVDSLLARAFAHASKGEKAFIDEAKSVARTYLERTITSAS